MAELPRSSGTPDQRFGFYREGMLFQVKLEAN
jgi:hypothetical protein